MTDAAFQVPYWFNYAATFTWAVTGAVVGIRKRFDVTGVFVIAFVSSSGGGFIRDAMFLLRTPTFILDPVYLPLVAATTLLMTLFTRSLTQVLRADTIKKMVDLIDAVGIPAFAVVGMQLAQDRQIPLLGVIFIGAVNGLAGGLLRDVIVGEVPALLRPGQFVSLTLVLVCALFIVLERRGVPPSHAAWAAVGTFVLLRAIQVRYNWQTRPVLPEDA